VLSLSVRMGGRRVAALFAMACATLGGAALVTGTGVLAESGLRSHVPAGRLGHADLVIAADQTFRQPEELPIALPERTTVPAELVGRLARLPGVATAVGDLSFPAALIDGRGQVVPTADPRVAGHGWSSTALLDHPGIDGTVPAGANEVAVDATIAAADSIGPGDTVTVAAAGHTAVYRVSAVVAAPGAGILFADPTATKLAARAGGAVDLVGVRAAPGRLAAVTDDIRRELRGSGLIVATGDARGDVESPSASAARSLLLVIAGSLSGITLVIVGFMVAGAMTVSIGGQRRDLALLRAVGATPRQLRRIAADQATAVTLAALPPGVALGYLLAGQFRELLVKVGMLPAVLPLSLSPVPALATALLLVAVAQVSARSAAWRTSRRPATEAVAESRSEPRAPAPIRTSAGLLLIVGATGLSVVPLLTRTQVGAAATPLTGVIAAIGLALAGPDLVRRAGTALARRLPARVSAPTWLAVANSHGYALRIAGATTTLAMAVIFTLTYALTQTTVQNAISADLHAGTRAQASLSAPELGRLPDGMVAAVRAVPGVRAAASVGTTTVLWPSGIPGDKTLGSTPALILGPAAAPVMDLDVRAGSLHDLSGNTVAVDTSQRLKVGRQVDMVLGDGAHATARVVAVYARGLGFGPVVISRDLAAGHTTAAEQTILVSTDGTAQTTRTLAAFAASRPGVRLDDPGAGTGAVGAMPPEAWVNLATLAVLLGYLLLGIANKLIASTAARRTELAALRLIGTTPRQIRAMMRREATLIFGFAITAGTLLSAIPLALLGIGLLHRPWPAGPVWVWPAAALTVAAIALLATEVPTRQALRATPAQALAIRE